MKFSRISRISNHHLLTTMQLLIAWSIFFLPIGITQGSPSSIAYSILAALLLSPLLINKFLTTIACILLSLTAVINLGHLRFFGKSVDEYFFPTLSRTNVLEIKEFQSTIPKDLFLQSGVCLTIFTLAFFALMRAKNSKILIRPIAIASSAIWAVFLGFIATKGLSPTEALEKLHRIYPFETVAAIVKSNEISSSAYYQPNLADLHFGSSKVDLLVVVLGESASSHRWSLLNYKVPTNRPLENRTNAIITSAQANGPNTATALPFLLTGMSAQNSISVNAHSFLDYGKSAGYEVFVYSNTRFYDRGEDFYNILLKRSANTYKKAGDGEPDEVLSPYLKEALSSPSKKKLIVLHTYGSHPELEKRVPRGYKKILDEYDNSIHYTSKLLDEWIDLVAANNTSAALIYTSDHGLTMPPCSTEYRLGHAKSSFEVPIYMWASQSNSLDYMNIAISSKKPANSAIIQDIAIALMGGQDNPIKYRSAQLSNAEDFQICDSSPQ